MNGDTGDTGGTITEHIDGYNTYLDKYPEGFKAQLKKNGQCLKCLGYEYRPGFKALY